VLFIFPSTPDCLPSPPFILAHLRWISEGQKTSYFTTSFCIPRVTEPMIARLSEKEFVGKGTADSQQILISRYGFFPV